MQSANVLVVIGIGGLGLHLARRLGVGRQILLADMSSDNLSAAEKILADEGYSVQVVRVDVTSFDSVTEVAQRAASMGRVETIVHTASAGPSASSARRVYELDLLGTANVVDAFLPVVGAGSNLVCVASMAGHLCPPLDAELERHLATSPREQLLDHPDLNIDEPGPQGAAAAYGLSKRGNLLRVQASAGAWGLEGARINSVSPGVVSTEMRRQRGGGAGEKFAGLSPVERAGSPEDFVNAIAFLANPASCFITGTDILVDGGVIAVPLGAVVVGGLGGGFFTVGGAPAQAIAAGASTVAGASSAGDGPDPDTDPDTKPSDEPDLTTPGATATPTASQTGTESETSTRTSASSSATPSSTGTTEYIIYPKKDTSKADRDGFYYTLAKIAGGEANIDSILDDDDTPLSWLAPLTAQQLAQVEEDRVVFTTEPNAAISTDPDTGADSTTGSPAAAASVEKRALTSAAPSPENNMLDLRLLSSPPGGDTLPNYVFDDEAAGEGITVYVLDVGPVVSHRELVPPARGITRRDIDKTKNPKRISPREIQHGTCVATKVVGKTTGSARRANLVVVRVTMDTFGMTKGWQAVRDDIKKNNLQGRAVLSTSTGGWLNDNADRRDAEAMYDMYRILVRGIVRLDVPVLCAAGNDAQRGYPEPHSFPALLSAELPVIVVGASDDAGGPAPFSQRGDLVTTWALGTDVYCGDTRDLRDLSRLRRQNGTSFAAPLVAGVVASWMSSRRGDVAFAKGRVAQEARDRVVAHSYKRGGSPDHVPMLWNGWREECSSSSSPSPSGGGSASSKRRRDGAACPLKPSGTATAQPTPTSGGGGGGAKPATTSTAADPVFSAPADPACDICGAQNGDVYGGQVGCRSAEYARQSCEVDPGCASWSFGMEDRGTYQIEWCGFYKVYAGEVAKAAPDADGKCPFRYSDKGCKAQ
ncbi:3-alpha-hydroxysteroid dehydrogenase/carbonyl reductase [Colletotrichum sidae]|uniref:3-alpha-hydroxysteroid dehydrogenase/carbonyl reductase n=1 Tax=Colletotrichum sidae TaxID=1347389 RepID=A0A4R8T1J4_9PEZI|nr:3-alpha-hydroxysteroid dehydrogenase/carbonyl reductase [Colletotrichum sidae]